MLQVLCKMVVSCCVGHLTMAQENAYRRRVGEGRTSNVQRLTGLCGILMTCLRVILSDMTVALCGGSGPHPVLGRADLNGSAMSEGVQQRGCSTSAD